MNIKVRKIIALMFYTLTLFISNLTVIHAQNYLQGLQEASRSIAKNAVQSVVTVKVTNVVEVQNSTGWLDYFNFNPFQKKDNDPQSDQESQKYKQSGIGSGIIVRRSKNIYYVLTNAHVVENADEIELVTHGNKEISATIVGKDKARDIALLSFKSTKEFKIAKLGNSDTLLPGDFVFAIGSPHGFEFSITFGIVSAIQRDSPISTSIAGKLTEYIQTDAAVNRGNSGGPLVNIRGEVVGINTWIYSRTGDNTGLSFAVPINNAVSSIEALIEYGDVAYGWLGIQHENVILDRMQSLTDTEQGSFVDQVYRNSPADKAGMLPGDIITSVSGKKINRGMDLLNAIASSKPGSRVKTLITRNARQKELQIILGKRNETSERSTLGQPWPGFSVIELTPEIRKKANISNKKGVMVAKVASNSAAFNSGLKSYDLIEKVNNVAIKNLREFYAELNKVREGEILFRVNRKGAIFILGIVK